MINLISVKSSNIRQIGYEENRQLSLGRKVNVIRIVFLTGTIYDYYNVAKPVFDKFLKAKSKGEYFHTYIKEKYIYEKVK